MSQKYPQSEALLTASASALARELKAGNLTSLEIVMAHQARLDQVNSDLNAMVEERREKALLESSRSDAMGGEQPFRGVPCSIKECFALKGMPQTSGLLRRKGIVAEHNATAVQRYLDAGAIPLGVTNTSELCMWMESDNLVYGRSNNPYDLGRTVGGSSGGEAAIIGAGAAPFGLGSDIGGSIRMPAFFNGVFGHKPSGGLVPGTGQHPIAEGEALRYLSTGPICRKAEDLWPLLRILAGPDGQDPGCQPMDLGDPRAVDLSSLRVLHIPESGGQPVSKDLRAAQARVAQALKAAGAQVEELRIPAMKHGFDIWSSMLQQANETPFTTLMGDGEDVSALRELMRLGMGRPNHTLMACLLGATEALTALLPRRAQRFVDMGLALKAELEERLGEDGVLLYPSYTMPAPKHGEPLRRQLRLSFDYAYTALLNVMELPVTQVPLGLNAQGLPLGVQVGAAHGQDHLCVAVALWAEREFGGWVPPWTV